VVGESSVQHDRRSRAIHVTVGHLVDSGQHPAAESGGVCKDRAFALPSADERAAEPALLLVPHQSLKLTDPDRGVARVGVKGVEPGFSNVHMPREKRFDDCSDVGANLLHRRIPVFLRKYAIHGALFWVIGC
jgi:hypothetical protein